MKKRITAMILAVLTALLSVGCGKSLTGKNEKAISVYLWSAALIDDYAPYIQSQLPDIEIEFVVGNNDLDFYEFLNEKGELPDIITNRRFSLHDAMDLSSLLLDLSGTNEAGSIYLSYLENYTNSDGTVNWLPLCGEVDGFIANRALFEKYGIPLPTDYESFVSACKAFEKKGIRGFVSDFCYDYTCMEILQGLSIPELTSMEGQAWRHSYENPTGGTWSLDDKIWPDVFRRMESFISDAGIKAEDTELGYDEVKALFTEEKAAIIRGTGIDVIGYSEKENIAPVMLPYFGQNGEEWLLTYPSFQVALNGKLANDEKRMEKAFRILNVMLSEKGQNVLAQKNDVLPYSRNTELELSDVLSNLKKHIEKNHLYVRMASNGFFAASKEVVQKMITGEYNANQAYEAFDSSLRETETDKPEPITSFDRGYSYEFMNDGGNEAASAMANTLREYYKSDVLIAPAYSFTGSVFKGEYSEKDVKCMIMPNALEAWSREMTGAELKEYLRVSVEGAKGEYTPFNRSSLPAVSGISIEVKENKHGGFTFVKAFSGGKEIKDEADFKVTCLNSTAYFEPIAKKLYPNEGIMAFEKGETQVRNAWAEYIKNGGSIAEPESYITLK